MSFFMAPSNGTNNCDQPPALLQHIMESLTSKGISERSAVEGIQSLLAQLSEAAASKLASLNRTSIINLPDDTLVNILGRFIDCERKAYDKEESDIHGLSSTRRALNLSTVCRRFRSVILHMPGAWSIITTDHRPEFIELCARRNADKGLRIFSPRWPETSSLVKFFTNLYQIQNTISSRIYSVNLMIRGEHGIHFSNVLSKEEELFQILKKLDNGFLHAVEVHYPTNFSVEDEIDAHEDEEGTQSDGEGSEFRDGENETNELSLFTRIWDFGLRHFLLAPNLQAASFHNTVPPPGLMLSLSKLTLKFDTCNRSSDDWDPDSDGWDVQKLVGLLQSQESLEHLALEFRESRTFKFGTIDGAVEGPTSLPSIKRFDLHWHASEGVFNYYTTLDVPKLFKLLNMENVEVFRFHLTAACIEDYENDTDHEMPLLVDEHLRFFLQGGITFPRLISFHLEFYSGNLVLLHIPASYIRNIRDLSLKLSYTNLRLTEPEEDVAVTVPRCQWNLETLTLHNCDTFTADTLQSFFDAMEKTCGCRENIKRLVVDECRFLSSLELKDVVELRKLELYPNTRIFRCYRD